MARQVAGSESTLNDAIANGDVPRPSLMDWNAWQSWRAAEGRRPKMRRDGYSISNTDEANLWALVMFTLYGNEWQQQLALRDSAEDDNDEEEDADYEVPEEPTDAARPEETVQRDSEVTHPGSTSPRPAASIGWPSSRLGSGSVVDSAHVDTPVPDSNSMNGSGSAPYTPPRVRITADTPASYGGSYADPDPRLNQCLSPSPTQVSVPQVAGFLETEPPFAGTISAPHQTGTVEPITRPIS